ncbi:MAG: hypothetical protein QUV05_18835 [Phycisphaerae bacterium]|nr:hypothetical protein [Phycisphaerae bacterium]
MSQRKHTPALLVLVASVVLAASWCMAAGQQGDTSSDPVVQSFQPRLEKALGQWCRWLSTYLYEIPGTDLYTLNPTLGTGNNPYRDVAGNTFAAAAAGYWLKRADPPEDVARPLRGLVKLVLGTHIAINAVDRPDIQKWGATLSMADDWHADLFAVADAMLLLDSLPPDQKEQMLKILVWEADKQVEYGISKKWRTWPGIWPAHSCGESNAWSATILQMARVAMPDSPRQAAWRESAMEYSLNAICMPADITSEKVVGGKPLKERVRAANFEPGGIQEHHGFYHPGYMGWPLAYQAYAHVMDQQLPESQRNPDVYLHNWKYAYDRLKQATLYTGRFIHCAGDDWITYGYGNTQMMPAYLFAAAHFKDPDATRMADEWIKMIELQQELGGGSVLAARLSSLLRFRLNDFSWYEGQEGCVLAQALWLLEHMKHEPMAPPASVKEFKERNVGTYYEPNVRMAWHRDAHGFSSVAWRSAFGWWQMLVQPVGLPHLLRYNGNGMGMIQATGVTPQFSLESFKIGAFDEGGFWTTGRIGRESKKVIHGRPDNQVFPMVRQHQALVALAGGPTLLFDWSKAEDQIWLLREGSLGLRLACDIYNDHQVSLAVDGKEHVFKPAECSDTWHDLQARSITIEKQMTIHALAGEGSFQLMQKRQRYADRSQMVYPEDRFAVDESLLAHELYFGPPSYDHPRIVSPQEWFRKTVLAMYCDPASTPARPTGTVSGEFPCIVVHLPDAKCSVAVNFGDKPSEIDTPNGRISVEAENVKVTR